MNTSGLLPWQVPAAEHLREVLQKNNAVDNSDLGTGKTFCACALVREFNLPTLVVCPKVVIPMWHRVAAHFGTELEAVNYELVRRGNTPFGTWVKSGNGRGKWFQWAKEIGFLIFDECFPAGTPVRAERGVVAIEQIQVGERVYTPFGLRTVVRHLRTRKRTPVFRVRHSRGHFDATSNHKILTLRGWVRTEDLTSKDSILYVSSCLRELRQAISQFKESQPEKLFQSLLLKLAMDACGESRERRKNAAAGVGRRPFSEGRAGEDDNPESGQAASGAGKDEPFFSRPSIAVPAWGQWARTYRAATTAARRLGGRLGRRVCGLWARHAQRLAFDVGGYSTATQKGGGRGERALAQYLPSPGPGQKEGPDSFEAWVASFLISKCGRVGACRLDCGAVEAARVDSVNVHAWVDEVFNIEVEGEHLFELGGGEIVSNCHRANGINTQNAGLVFAAKRQDIRTLALTATLGDTPMKLRAIGYLIGLHRGDDFYRWVRSYGCRPGAFGGFEMAGNAATRAAVMARLHKQIFPARGVRVRVSEIPEFPETSIQPELYKIDDPKKVNALYSEMEAQLAALKEKAAHDKDKSNPLTIMLRARQQIELLKVPVFEDLAKDAIEQGMSVAIFINFKETLQALCDRLGTKCCIHGGQTGEAGAAERQKCIDDFQSDRERIIICNTAAGGVGLSLHDLNGRFPRLSLISPSFSATEFRQVLGRVHRAGGKSKSIQRVIFCAGTIESDIHGALTRKLNALDALQDGDLAPANLVPFTKAE